MVKNNDKEKNDSIQESIEKEKIQEQEILNDLQKEDFKRIVELGFSMQRISGPLPNPLLSKINEKHIDKILEITEKEEENSFKDAHSTKIFSLIYFIIIVSFLSFLIYYLVDKDSVLLNTILEKGLYFLGGFSGGYGFKAYLDNKKKNS
jgi:hypothetical protein